METKIFIQSGICKCGHSWEDHHLSIIANKEYWERLLKVAPDHPGYVPEECEFYSCNETGGLDAEGNDHCHHYEDDPEPCRFGCIFHNGKLFGDCRMPESDACLMGKEITRWK